MNKEKHPKAQMLYAYDQKQKIKCKHTWDQPINKNGTTITVRINGDAFIQTVTCINCNIKVDWIFSNKHPEQYISNGTF